jgi:alkanesulfonate monooxygenase SsuD/methylene tetrahydromethanopterin reductase-like flavin-dependent oxidoreductase (luciferase family)
VKYGVTLTHNDDVRDIVELGCEAEAAGWDGVFVWDGIDGNDVWVTLATIAARTERIRLGTMLTPVSRRRPWKLAQETATLDRLSGGRVILPVGLGAPETGFARFGEEVDRRRRADMLDEGLAVLEGLWSGEPFSFEGEHFQLDGVTYSPIPVQQPRIPVWVVGAWPRPKSMRRVLRFDGVIPNKFDATGEPLPPNDIRAMKAWIDERRTATTPFDIIWEDDSPGDAPEAAATQVRTWADAGVTWWLESVWNRPRTADGIDGMRERIRQGPPGMRGDGQS